MNCRNNRGRGACGNKGINPNLPPRNPHNVVPHREDLFYPFEQVFDKFFSDFFHSDPTSSIKKSSGFPKMDVMECGNEFTISIAASGMKSDDIDLEITPENTLIVKGRVNESYREVGECAVYYIKELRMSNFEREIRLPTNVEGDPKAVMKDGILKLTWVLEAEEEEEPQVRKISIDAE